MVRSNALYGYGSRMTYKEQNVENSFPQAVNGFLGLLLVGVIVFNRSLRNAFLSLGFLPSPGNHLSLHKEMNPFGF